VQKGDYLEIFGDPALRYINEVLSNTQLKLGAPRPSPLTGFTTTKILLNTAGGAGANYRIHRAPRPIPGEPNIVLSNEASIDMDPQLAPDLSTMLNDIGRVPERSITTPAYREIVFSPYGGVLNRESGKVICILVSDAGTPAVAAASVITIVPNTAFIAAHPKGVSDPYEFCTDTRASGL
jgi:hypothetical protein